METQTVEQLGSRLAAENISPNRLIWLETSGPNPNSLLVHRTVIWLNLFEGMSLRGDLEWSTTA